jgi:Rrf2 family protein
MKFTAQEEYGVRCLLQMAREPEGFGTIPDIAEREGLSIAYVAKLMRVMRRAGLVASHRGQKGGYRLARPADQMNLGRVLAALGGRLYPDDFCERHAGARGACVHTIDCSVRTLWSALDSVVQRALKDTTLKDLVSTERQMESFVTLHIQAPGSGGIQSPPRLT